MGGGGNNFIAGVFVRAKKEKLSIYHAMVRGLLTPGTALVLLEAQAASGLLTDPVRNERLSVKAALASGLIGPDFYEKLLSAEGAVTGYAEPYTGRRISLFQAMKQEFIVREHATRLLEAQLATGGIIDPAHGHRLPVEVACERGYLDREMGRFLCDPENQTRSCFDPNTQENLTYLQLLRRCVPDPDTGLLMLQLMDKGSALYQLGEDARRALQDARTTLGPGLFQGQSVTLWELLFSRYVPELQREELLRKYKAGTVTVPQMTAILAAAVTGAETGDGALSSPSTAQPNNEAKAAQDAPSQEQQLRRSLKSATVRVAAGEFRGRNVSLLDLLFSKHVPQGKRQELLELYRAGILSTEQVAAVVAAVLNRAEAADAALVARARTPRGAVARAGDGGDPCSAPYTHLDEVLKSTTIDVPAGELQGRQVSLWDLLFSDYVPEEKRQELLELYHERLLTLEQMTTVATALIKKKESTGRKFHIKVKASDKDTGTGAGEEPDEPPEEELHETALKSTVVDMEVGEFRGHRVSVWDLLHSRYIPEENRKELLELYEAGELSLEQVKSVVTTIVTKAVAARAEQTSPVGGPEAEPTGTEAEPTPLHGDMAWEETLKATPVEGSVDEFQGRQVSLWDLLFSDHIPEEKRQELLELYREGTLALEQLTLVVTTLIKKSESTSRKFQIKVKASDKDTGTGAGGEGDESPEEEPRETALKSTAVDVEVGEFRGHRVSVWDLLHSRYIPEENRKELLELYEAGELSLEQVKSVVTTIVTKAVAARSGQASPVGGPEAEPTGTEAEPTGTEAEPTPLHGDMAWEETLKATPVEGSVDEFQGRQVSLWDLLFSDCIPAGQRQELLELYREGTLTVQELLSTTSSLVAGRQERHLAALLPRTADLLRSEGSYLTFGPCQERRVSVWELLSSRRVSEYKREARLDTYGAGGLTVNRITVTTTVITGPQRQQSPRRHH